MSRRIHDDVAQGIAVNIGCNQGDGLGGVLVSSDQLVVSHRCVVDCRHRDGERLWRGCVHTSVGCAPVVMHLHPYEGNPIGIGRRGVGQGSIGGYSRPRREEARIIVAVYDEIQGLGALIRGPCADAGGPAWHSLRPCILQNTLVTALSEARYVVDRRHRDGERLWRGCVHTAVGSAPVVMHLHPYEGNPIGIGRRGVGQGSIGGYSRPRREEARIIVAVYDEIQGLGALIRGPCADAGGPAWHSLRPCILQNTFVTTLGEARGIVDCGDSDAHRGYVGIEIAIVGLIGEGIRSVVVGCWNICEIAVGIKGNCAV